MIRLLLLFCLLVGGVVHAQENVEEGVKADDGAQARQLQRDLDKRFLELEQSIYDQNELGLRRLEFVEGRVDASDRHNNQVLLIFALTFLLVVFFIVSGLRAQQRLALERVNQAARNTETLMGDIQRELSRPELEHLRISQLLRRLMRQLRDPEQAPSAENYLSEVRVASADPYLPTALHFIARVLTAEHDGNWNIAAQMLEQLREMEPKDPDVLLHLSHVHKSIALRSGDRAVAKRHQRMAYQYYGQFTAAIKSDTLAASLEIPDRPQGEQTLAAPATAKMETIPSPAVPAEMSPPPAKMATPPPAVKTATPPVKTVSPLPATKTASAPPPVKTAIPPPAEAVSALPPAGAPAKAASPSAERKPAATAPSAGKKSASFSERVKGFKATNIKGNIGNLTKSVPKLTGQGLSKISNIGSAFVGMVKEKESGELPFLPVPEVSEVPVQGDAQTINMWKKIRSGDELMQKALAEVNMRNRNRLIDGAIIHYAEAQSFKTNETLYHNWGIALLAKALHVNDKKRSPFYNAAVDKFMAGNVVRPHYFDFHLASLYAIIGNEEECLNWLTKSREAGALDVQSLLQAPDFDSVRSAPWFDQFLET